MVTQRDAAARKRASDASPTCTMRRACSIRWPVDSTRIPVSLRVAATTGAFLGRCLGHRWAFERDRQVRQTLAGCAWCPRGAPHSSTMRSRTSGSAARSLAAMRMSR